MSGSRALQADVDAVAGPQARTAPGDEHLRGLLIRGILVCMMRVLDLDLDFFVHGVEYMRESDGPRPSEWVSPWSIDAAMSFLEDRCGLSTPLPGAVVEHHGEMFGRWRDAIDAGHLPALFSVTHVDAHADLGLGDAAYVDMAANLLYQPVEVREGRPGSPPGLGDGNFLAFAIACRWLSDLTYVHNDEGGHDLLVFHMLNYENDADVIQLKAMSTESVYDWAGQRGKPTPDRVEPSVPFRQDRWDCYEALEPFDAVCLCRSPGFTPAGCDSIFDEIRRRFIDEAAWR